MNKAIDWESVELNFRLGVKTLRNIATEHDCAESSIRKRANRDGWTRDLAAKVRMKAQSLVQKAAVRNVVRTETPVERQQIEVFAHAQSNVILRHRRDIQRARRFAMILISELETLTNNLDLLEQLRQSMYSPDETGRDKRDERFRKAISLSSRVAIMKTLADSLKNLIAIEYEVFGLNEGKESDSDIESVIKHVIRINEVNSES